MSSSWSLRYDEEGRAYYADAACATSTSKVLAFTDVCLPEAGQQVAVVLTACSASALAGSLFAAPSMAAAPTCTGNAQVFAASAACTQVGTTGVYTKALDFTCASGGAAYVSPVPAGWPLTLGSTTRRGSSLTRPTFARLTRHCPFEGARHSPARPLGSVSQAAWCVPNDGAPTT